MPVGDLLNWDFILPQYTDKTREEMIRELQKKRQELQKAVKDYKKNMNKVRYMENMKEKSSYMTFSTVLDMMKKYRQNNLRFRREGWNGKGMYIMLWTGAYMGEYPPNEKIRMVSYELSEMLVLRTSYGQMVPWCPSQTDILCDDWVQLPEQPKTAIVEEKVNNTKDDLE